MSIIVFAETNNNQFKKSAFEAISFAAETGKTINKPVIAVVFGAVSQPESAGNYGASEVIQVQGADSFQAEVYAETLATIAREKQAEVVVVSNSYAGKAISGKIAVKLQASLATNVVGYPDSSNGFSVKRGVFSGKAFGFVNLSSNCKVLAITPNSFELKVTGGSASVSSYGASGSAVTSQVSESKVTGKIPLTEAEIVVSGGRGMKGPENWNLIEDLASALGAATACSKPVSDMHWRPHSEHVGQTGITIKPNLYIAVGISGAIQHLAGVSSSKVIVAINKDPEAPFFKAADYGIVGDAFEVLPKLIDAARAAKG